MNEKLTGSAGTGKCILQNWNNFKFDLVEVEDDFYTFDIRFNNQEGYVVIKLVQKKVEQITIDCKFNRPLGCYNDSSLKLVGSKMIDSLKLANS
ncbi:MAG: hypothetical protein N4A57_10235 [Anaeromicrobium sp.]|jgi:hypothetical protein|uniref:hypothetical protein n=1 Tax=Anaeromicrobium sp. TaxID=1929132 RepID=UPI0025CD9316|nr:hypothetical protein [Anaeromicrobium sp.]MCT4594628.1 hypothetical protein [Anaeromicrobium sp.]